MLMNVSKTLHLFAILLVSLLLLLAYGEASTDDLTAARPCRKLKFTSQPEPAIALSWITPRGSDDKKKLDLWCDTIGPALLRSPQEPGPSRKGRIIVVNWNVHLGNGNVVELIDELTADERKAGRGEPHFVFLLQEAFRRGIDVPSEIRSDVGVPGRIPSSADDIEALARKLDWWMFYVPSMRNGKQSGAAAEDRGNAILSSLPLEGLEAIELPFSVQRRVAITATVHDRDRAHRFRVTSVHLDTRAPLNGGFIFGASAARNRQAKWVAEVIAGPSSEGLSLIVGGDLNSFWGAFESSVDTLVKVAPQVDCGGKATHKFGFTLDHIFARFSSLLAPVSCRRPDNRFGSDHYPLILSLTPA